MPTPSYVLRCLKKELVARDTYELFFERPAGFTFKGGQSVLWKVPLVEDETDIQPRAYSIASGPSEPELRFVIRLKEGGRTSRWIVERLEVGSMMEMQGPFGLFTLKHESPPPAYLFIATGTGIAPFRAHVLELGEKGYKGRIDVVFGVRDEQDVFWKEELAEWSRCFPECFTHYALSQPSSEWTGHRGRVQTLVPLIAKDVATREIYVCGSPVMTKELKGLCLEQWGSAKERLHVEGFI
ncbi:MAG: hypothetical protein KBC95_03150 [Candidatus Peribacteraceae bacterium]|nr:hypothetical protein [Candidatus Peribacteraceae bacterium]